MDKPWKVVLVFVGVFLAGAICGGPLIGRWFGPGPGLRPPGRPQMMQRFEEELTLTEAQKLKIQPLVKQTEEETQRLRRENVKAIAALMEKLHGQIAAELTPEQKVKLEQMQRKFRERAEQVRKEFRDGGPPMGPPPPDEGEPPPPPPNR